MQIELLERMVCPYCGGRFEVRRNIDGDDERVRYGTVECRCFTFPVVDGVLLLSLAKGYGGAEESLQPYVPLQVAAVRHLETGDVSGLRRWIRRHAPLAGELIDGTQGTYLEFAWRLGRRLDTEVDAFLDACGRYEVVGTPRSSAGRAARAVAAAIRRRRPHQGEARLPTPADYFEARFFSPRVNALALQFDAHPHAPRLLSLCCGHGVFENLLRATGRGADVVSVDAQLLNLLITRRFADHGGTYICHDVQFPLPFSAGSFEGVFSSTCLPEVPAQQTFVAEAIRVTAETGWTQFDSIWNADIGASRIDPRRYYRFAQNFFSSLDDYVPMFDRCAGPGRRIGLDVPGPPVAYVDGPRWRFGTEIDEALRERADEEISFVVLGPEFPGFVTARLEWLRPDNLAASMAFDLSRGRGRIDLRRRPEFDALHPAFAPRQFGGYPRQAQIELGRTADRAYLASLFGDAIVTVVPPNFTADGDRRLTGGGFASA